MKKNIFTLIELFIVVAVIAILMGMFLPALNKARKAAQGTQCISNAKQVGIALAGYFSDFREYFPPTQYGSVDTMHSIFWTDLMADTLNMKRKISTKYKRGHGLQCPSMNLPAGNSGNYDSIAYAYNQQQPDWTTGYYGFFIQLSQIKSPAHQLTHACAWAETGVFDEAARRRGVYRLAFSQQIAFRHNHRSTALYLDGHVSMDDQTWLRLGKASKYPLNRGDSAGKITNLPWERDTGKTVLTNFSPFN